MLVKGRMRRSTARLCYAALSLAVVSAIGATAASASAQPTGAPSRAPAAVTAPVPSEQGDTVYTVVSAKTSKSRTTVAKSGVDVLGFVAGKMQIAASPSEVKALQGKGFKLQKVASVAEWVDVVDGKKGTPRDFPPGYEGYHNLQEMTDAINKAATDHKDIAAVSSLGKSHEDRDINVVKISDNVGEDEAEPEVLFNCQQHAREILTREMCLRIIDRLTGEYDSNPTIKEYVDNREIYVIPTVNPDGAEYDISTGDFQMWRKNRQGEGTDLNRNWAYKWGCCDGSSSDPGAEDYRGEAAFDAPESKVVSDFVNSRVVDGKQQITTNIDFHTYGELVLWPFGYTMDDTAEDMSAEEAKVFQDFGKAMADTNGYTPEQSSDLYITDGDITDWMWGQHKIWSYTFEMYGNDFYPEDSVIEAETARNDKAVDLMLEYADCVPRINGGSCG